MALPTDFRFNLQRFADTEILPIAPALVKQGWAEDRWLSGMQLSQDAGNILSIANDGLKGDMKVAGDSAVNSMLTDIFGASNGD